MEKRALFLHQDKQAQWKVKLPLPKFIYRGLTRDGFGTYLSRVAKHICHYMPKDVAEKCSGQCVVVGMGDSSSLDDWPWEMPAELKRSECVRGGVWEL